MRGAIYLLCTSRGFFISFSKAETISKSKILGARAEELKIFYSASELTKNLCAYAHNKLGGGVHFRETDIRMNSIKFWQDYGSWVSLDLKSKTGYRFWRDGVVDVFKTDSGVRIGQYANCQTPKVTNAKTVAWIKKHGIAYGYNFEENKTYKYIRDELE